MTAYLLTLLFVTVICTISDGLEANGRIAYVACFALLGILMVLRDVSVGTDTMASVAIFRRIGMAKWSASILALDGAPIYGLWCKVLWTLFPMGQTIVVANGIVISLCHGFFLYRFSNGRGLAVVLYVVSYAYLSSFNVMRQSVAVSLCLVAFCFLASGKKLPCLIVAILAVGVHNTALFMLIMLVVVGFRIYREVDLGNLLVGAFLFAIVLRGTYRAVYAVFMQLFPRYQLYADSAINYTSLGRSSILYILYLLIFLLYALMLERGSRRMGGISAQVFMLAFVGLAVRICFFDLALAVRIAGYLTPFIICALSRALYEMGLTYRSVAPAYLMGLVSIVAFVAMLSINIGGVVPYEIFH